MTATTPPRLVRRRDGSVLAGVARGIAEHTRISAVAIRVAFVLLVFAGGLGLALYGAFWIVLPADAESTRKRFSRVAEFVMAVLALAAAVGAAASSFPTVGGLFIPAVAACLGGALIWRQASETERVRLRRFSRVSLSAGGREWQGQVRLLAGIVLVLAGAVYVLARADVTAVRDGLVAMVVTVVGLALITGPWWMRMVTQLSDERAERVRSQERADIAAQLHDSVLQTLALIQRNASSPREVARLARGQERDLRSMLYDGDTVSGQFGDRLRSAAAEVEDAYAVSIEVVVVGDAVMDERLGAVSAAAREALVNAAKHSGVTDVSLYAEIETDEVSVFVKDRGMGFEEDDVAGDRQGVRGSIIARVERHGGRAAVHTARGAGTEIEIHLPVRADA